MTLHHYAVLTAAATFLLLAAGSLVTSTDSGLAVPDWPLSYGTWFPPMVGGIRFEHGHRMIAGLVGLMILALALRVWRREPRRWVQRLGWAALGGVIAQALLGGLTVLLLLPPPVSIAHACLGQSVFCLVVSLAWCTAPGWDRPPVPADDPHWMPTAVLGFAVVPLAGGQLLLGAVIRHTGQAVAAHLAGALLLAGTTSWLALRAWRWRSRTSSVWRAARRLLLLLVGQLALGGSVFAHRGSLPLRTGHVLIGALVLVQSVLLAWETQRMLPAPSGRRRWREWVGLLLELTKARLALLVLLTTGVGYWLAMRAPEELSGLFPVCVGIALVVGGANALNQWMERGPDALMQRTKTRPIPSGRLSPDAAFRIGLLLSVAGLVVLALAANPLSAAVALASWISYVFLYTPLKRVTPLCTLVGAIPGALPPVIGWAAARNSLEPAAWALFVILFLWQLPHFLAIAVLHRDDYGRAGFPMLPLTEPDGLMTARQMVLYGLTLLPISLVPSVVGLSGPVYFYGALALSGAFLLVAARAAWLRSPQSAAALFRASILYLPVLLALLAIDRAPL
jgi:protoheme IX farnesyltransferase